MARAWRIQYSGAVYHVTSRGNRQAPIFFTDEDRIDFLGLLGDAVSRFNLEVFAFCLMDNHYHVFLRTPDGNLSRAFHWLNTTYTVRFHRRHKQSGHFLQGRFKAVLVLGEAHWHHLSIYIHLNPVRAGIVGDPAAYEWSSFRDYTRSNPRFSWLSRDIILAAYGEGKSRYRIYRNACISHADTGPKFIEQLRSNIAIGSSEALKDVLKKYKPSGSIEKVPSYRNMSKNMIDVEKELEKVADVFRVKPFELKRRRRNFPSRLAAYWHLVNNCGMRTTEVAALMKVKQSAISNGIAKFKNMIKTQCQIRKKADMLSVK